MLGWDFPFGIIVTVVAGVLFAAWLLRVGKAKVAVFECLVCGRKQAGAAAREWRYCPYCGVPRPPPPRIPGINLS